MRFQKYLCFLIALVFYTVLKVEIALDFESQVILSERSKNMTWRYSLKIKSFTIQNMLYKSDILHSFSISSLSKYILTSLWVIVEFFDLLEPNI